MPVPSSVSRRRRADMHEDADISPVLGELEGIGLGLLGGVIGVLAILVLQYVPLILIGTAALIATTGLIGTAR